MNYDNLTPEEAFALYESSGFDGLELVKRKLEIRRGTFFVKNYRNTNGNVTYIKGQFRGFLIQENMSGWRIYIGDEYQCYWRSGSIVIEWQNEWNEGLDAQNMWSSGPLYDITDLICKGWEGQFINWRTDPFEVKS